MKAHIFTDDGKQWKFIPELPTKPREPLHPNNKSQNESPDYYLDLEKYEHDLAEAKANALTIVNPEVALLPGHCTNLYVLSAKLLKSSGGHPRANTHELVELGKLYEWPGTSEDIYSGNNVSSPFEHKAKLIAPQQPQGSNETGKVIFDEECKEYKEGWNANNRGAHYLSNPYGLAYNGELRRLWEKGFNDNQVHWDNPDKDDPKAFSEEDIKSSFTITDPKNQTDF